MGACAKAIGNFQNYKFDFELKFRFENISLIHELYSALVSEETEGMAREKMQYI